MTPEMAFECLLVSTDPAVFSTMDGILHDFSISTKVCAYPSKAAHLLAEGSTDLVVIDLEAENASEFVQKIASESMRQKTTVLAVSQSDRTAPGVHVILQKPVTHESGLTSLKAAYSRMVREYRQHTRFAVMTSLSATNDENRSIQITVTNIGEGGVGLTSTEPLRMGSVLSFRMRLPGLDNDIPVRARILWTKPYGVSGCEFAHIAPFDRLLLGAWLESRYRVKKPLISV